MSKDIKIRDIFTERRMFVTLLLAFSSGFPLLLPSGTLSLWFADKGISLQTIGFVSLASLPYTFKFLWAPVMDRWIPPFLGRRRGWMLICQIALAIFLAGMAFLSPEDNANTLVFLAFFVAFFGASQDIVIDAYRVDLLKPEERPYAAAITVTGYRIGMLVAGSLPLVIAHYMSWKYSYFAMAALMVVGGIATFLGPEPDETIVPPKNLKECTIVPFVEFLSRPFAVSVLFLILFYKLGDAFAGTLTQTFLIRGVGLSKLEIGTLIKVLGFSATILGAFVGGLYMNRLGYYYSLLIYGILQALSNLVFIALLWTGPNMWAAGFAIFMDNLCGGLGTAAFTALLMSLCNVRFSAFQYALLSALSSVGRVFVGPIAGYIAEHQGWEVYFISSLFVSLPGLFLLTVLRNRLDHMREDQVQKRELNSSPAAG